MCQLADEIYPEAEQVVLVMDNLNTHSKASLYEAFEPAVPHRLVYIPSGGKVSAYSLPSV